MPRFAFDLAD
jgi:hypothetical protein